MKKRVNSLSINSPIPAKLGGECKKAAKILNSFIDLGTGLVDKVIPESVLQNAQGLAIFTVLKAGFLFSGRAGSGLVVARLPDNSWSAPSAIGTAGAGAGGQIGAELTDFVLVLNTKEAVKTFSQFGNITLGGNVSLAAGPIGRNAEASGSASLKHIAAVYSYSKTRGLFAGVSLEGSVILTRNDANEKFYGRRVTAKELLNGSVAPPPEADPLYRALGAKFNSLGNIHSSVYNRNRGMGEEGEENGTGSTSQVYRSTTISKPGTLRAPPVNRQVNSSSAPRTYGSPSPSPAYAAQKPYTPPAPPPSYTSPPSIHKPQYAAPPPPPPVAPRRPAPEPVARALYAFKGDQPGDLSFEEGQIIVIVEKTDSQDDWWTGKIGKEQGLFPANYVELE
ncbi:hypothetical protein BDA99DRAFT_564497 [Phascolomyces articulosus]|uniref:SH3 domain-containing protein n=1 Tax=Phascolomyces articulosus TaxID=60185 RepID=A0AAD5JQM3_9FUNG|nr:hypothetical protein BDA99DRAFT_564497 [Phascolomyces articulosus]